VYFPKSLQRIREDAFGDCHSLILAELPSTAQIHDRAFLHCFTLQLRQAQIEYNTLTREQIIERSRESVTWLKVKNDELPIHKICSDPNITQDRLQPLLISHHSNNNNNNINNINMILA